MTHAGVLTAGQRALLEDALKQRLQVLDTRLLEHQGGLTRAEHAHEFLAEDTHDAPHREGERELAMAQAERDTRDLAAASQALARLRDGAYGRCADCDEDIPFARLKAEPWALRCVDCETKREAIKRRAA